MAEIHALPQRHRSLTSSTSPRPTQRLLTPQQIKYEYGIPASTLRDLCYAGRLARVVLGTGRRWWFLRADLDRYIAGARETGAR